MIYLALVAVSSVLSQNSHWLSPAMAKIYLPVSGAFERKRIFWFSYL